MDYPIKIAVCRRKTDRQYVNQTATWSSLRERNRSPVRTPETAAQYQTLPKPERDAAKDQGGFVGGWLRDGLRKNGCVLSRCVGALDADSIPAGEDFPARVRLALPDNNVLSLLHAQPHDRSPAFPYRHPVQSRGCTGRVSGAHADDRQANRHGLL